MFCVNILSIRYFLWIFIYQIVLKYKDKGAGLTAEHMNWRFSKNKRK